MEQKSLCKKSVLALVISVIAVTGSFAQFSVGPELQVPMSTPFSDNSNLGFGGSATYQAPINDNLSWTGYFGYFSYSGKAAATGFTSSFIPVMAGVKYYFTESGNGFYGELDLGMFFASASGPNGFSNSDSKFGFTPAVGYRVGSFDLGARYNIVDQGNNLAFRVAYVFGAK